MRKKIFFTEAKYIEYKDKWTKNQSLTGSLNEKTLRLFQDIIEDALNWFSNEVQGTKSNNSAANNIKTLNDNCELPSSTNSLLIHFNKVRNELAHPNPPILGAEDYSYFNKRTFEFIKFFKPDDLQDTFEYFNPSTNIEQSKESIEKFEDKVYDEHDPSYLGKYGHYRINDVEFISIYGFKKSNGIPLENNGQDSLNMLNSKVQNYKAIPEVGSFKIVRVFPMQELKKYFSKI